MPVRGTNRRAFIAALSGAAGVADGGAGAMMLGNMREPDVNCRPNARAPSICDLIIPKPCQL